MFVSKRLVVARPLILSFAALSLAAMAGCASNSTEPAAPRAQLGTPQSSQPPVEASDYDRPQPWPAAGGPAAQGAPAYQPVAASPATQPLAPLQSPQPARVTSMRPIQTPAASERPATPSRASPAASADATARTIDVQQGDTLYGIARRHKVKVEQLMAVNNLTSPNIAVGQKLVLP